VAEAEHHLQDLMQVLQELKEVLVEEVTAILLREEGLVELQLNLHNPDNQELLDLDFQAVEEVLIKLFLKELEEVGELAQPVVLHLLLLRIQQLILAVV
jgi:hypothetical protein